MYYFVGINEPEIRALAQLVASLGYKVSGSANDLNIFIEKSLKEKGIKLLPGSPNNIHDDMIIIKGDHVSNDNEEIIKADELGLKIYSSTQMIRRFTEMFQTIIVSGSTFKQTTTAMLTYILANIIGCNYLLTDGRGYADKDNKFLILEACEDKKKFLDYAPYYAIITSIDLCYMDYYNNLDEIINAYNEFGCKAEKMVLANGDDRYTHLLEVDEPIFYYGLNDDNDIIAKEIEYTKDGISFEVDVEDNYYGEFNLPIYGKTMLLNVLSVIAICYYERMEAKYVSASLNAYFKENNQFNEKKINDTIIVDNLIRHPNEIKAIIKGLKQKYPNKKIYSILNIDKLSYDKKLENYLIDVINLFDKNYIIKEKSNSELLAQINNKDILDNLFAIKDNILMIVSNQVDIVLKNKIEDSLNKLFEKNGRKK